MGDSPGTGSQDGLSRTGSNVSFEFKGDTQEWERILPDLSTLCSNVDTACSATVVFLASLTVCSSVPLGKLNASDKKEPCSLFWWRQTSVWQLGSTGFASILPIPKGSFFFFFFFTVYTSCCTQTQSLPLTEWKNRLIQSDLESKMLEPCRDKGCLRQVDWMRLRCHGWLWSSCKIPFGFLQSLMKLRRRLSCVSHVVQSPSLVWLFMTPWTEAHQASLSLTIS